MRTKTKQTKSSLQYAFIMYLPQSDSFMSDVGESVEFRFASSLEGHVANMLKVIDRGDSVQMQLDGLLSYSQDEDDKRAVQQVIDLLKSIRSGQLKGADAVKGFETVFEGLSDLCVECGNLMWQGKAEELLDGQLELGKSLRRWYRANIQFDDQCAECDDPEDLEFPSNEADDKPLSPQEQKNFIKVMKRLNFNGGNMTEQAKESLLDIVK